MERSNGVYGAAAYDPYAKAKEAAIAARMQQEQVAGLGGLGSAAPDVREPTLLDEFLKRVVHVNDGLQSTLDRLRNLNDRLFGAQPQPPSGAVTGRGGPQTTIEALNGAFDRQQALVNAIVAETNRAQRIA